MGVMDFLTLTITLEGAYSEVFVAPSGPVWGQKTKEEEEEEAICII